MQAHRCHTRGDDCSTSAGGRWTGAARASSESDDDAVDGCRPPRRRRRTDTDSVTHTTDMLGLTLEVEEQSTVADCGVQLWRGAFLLADWLLHCEHNPSAVCMEPVPSACGLRTPKLAVGMELGCGVGLCSIVLARICDTVFATDLGPVLTMCARNVDRNTPSVVIDGSCEPSISIRVRSLDWRSIDVSSPLGRQACQVPQEHAADVAAGTDGPTLLASDEWTIRETDADALSQLSVVVAADVLYDASATVAFVRLLPLLLLSTASHTTQDTPPRRRRWLWLSLERRIVFSVAERRAHAPAVELFFELLEADGRFTATQISTTDIPQRCIDYERTPQLELWQVEPKTSLQATEEVDVQGT